MSQIYEKRYTSEIKHYRKIALGETEAYFLGIFSVNEKSTYGIFAHLKDLTVENKALMAYKNVHLRVKRLETLGLIERVETEFKRNEIKYRLTPYGLFQRLILSSPPFDYTPPTVLDKRLKTNAVLQMILYQYFEEESVKAFLKSLPFSMLLADYLRETCEAVVRKLDEWRSIPYNDNMPYAMDELITDRIENFVYHVVIFSYHDGITRSDIDEKPILDKEFTIIQDRLNAEAKKSGFVPAVGDNEDMGDDEDEDLKIIRVLAKDKKFIKLLKKMKQDFDEGCEVFI